MLENIGNDPEITQADITHFRKHCRGVQHPREARTLIKTVLEPLEDGRMIADIPGDEYREHRQYCALVLMHADEIRRVADMPGTSPKFSDAEIPGAKLEREEAVNALLSSGVRFSELNDSTTDGRLKYLREPGSYSNLQRWIYEEVTGRPGGKLISMEDMGRWFRSGHLVRKDDLALGTGFDYSDLEVGSETLITRRARQCVAEAEGIYMLDEGKIFLLSPGGWVGGPPETDQLGTLLIFREITGYKEIWGRRGA